MNAGFQGGGGHGVRPRTRLLVHAIRACMQGFHDVRAHDMTFLCPYALHGRHTCMDCALLNGL